MNNTFNYIRFVKLFRKHTVENCKSYLMSAMVLTGVITILYGFSFLMDGYIRYEQRGVYFVFLYVAAGTLFTSTVFSDYGKKGKAIVSLSLPASHFEKYMIGWIYSAIIYTIIFLICFYGIEVLFTNAGDGPAKERKILNLFSSEYKFYFAFYVYATLHAICIYGAIYFKRLHFIKTACVFFAVLLVLVLVNFQLQKLLVPEDIKFSMPFKPARFSESGQYKSISIPMDAYYTQFMFYSVTLILWTAALFRFKETEV
ncbi:MAG TPA: hypothetical protein VNI52_12705 [Sphingobacteriaceae bacterium]|nr:hypothetical protein [Sphingobacteriaceae bacterium]